VIPTLDRPKELALCLEGFAAQSAPRDRFEVVVVDDGSLADVTPVAARFADALRIRIHRQPNAGIAAARNAGIDRASARLLILWDDDLRPCTDLVERCLDFHRRHRAVGDSALLYFEADAAIAASPVVRWGFDRLYRFPDSAGPHGWPAFWGGAVTCKRGLFEHGRFDPAFRWLEDAELASRLSRSVPLRVHFERRVAGTMVRDLTFEQVCRRQYLMGYYRCLLAGKRAAEAAARAASSTLPSAAARNGHEARLVSDPARLDAMLKAARGLEQGLATGAARTGSRRFELLCALWSRVEAHAEASGWVAAREGGPPAPPEAAPRQSGVVS
jgi:glycosyltransferase involved in cell wall biosynthesis